MRSRNVDNEFNLKIIGEEKIIYRKHLKNEGKTETGSRDLNMKKYNYDRHYIKRD
jgi:hypothetical protein